MHEQTLTLFLVSIEDKKAEKVVIEHSLQAFYDTIHTINNTIDIVSRNIGGKNFDIICDDDGLAREPHHCSAVDKEGNPMLVGSFLVANHDEAGETRSLTDEDIALIQKSVQHVCTRNLPMPHPIIVGMEY